VAEVVRASPESIEDTPSYVSQHIESEYVLGLIKQGDRLVTLVDPIKILALSTGAETGAGGGQDG